MKIRHLLINLLPLPLWLLFYVSAMNSFKLVFDPSSEYVLGIFILVFTLYNFFAKKIWEFLVRNCVFLVSIVSSWLISGQIYLEYCPHMSDEHYAAISVPFDVGLFILLFTLIVGAIKIIIHIIKNRKTKIV
ncbi:MAG: hypothetical protein IJO50_04175 [Clostridia bacterium]|nr:hypothetical protein [Clostridia bacterium]